MTSAMRPGRALMTTTRDDRKTASGIECVTNTTVVPVCSQMRRTSGVHPLAGHLVERAERLVHQQDRRLEGERPGDRDALLHAARQLVRVVLDEVAQLDEVEHLLGPRLPSRAVDSPSARAGSSTLSSTVRQSNRTGAWKTIP